MDITLIKAALSYGADNPGIEKGPDYLLSKRLIQQIESLGNHVADMVTVEQEELPATEKFISGGPKMKWLDPVLKVTEEVRVACEDSIDKGFIPFVLGGDHAVSLGSVKASVNKYDNLGIIWFDSHADMNTEETTPSGNIHGMMLAAAMGKGDKRLQCGMKRFIDPKHIILAGARSVDPGERELIKNEGITEITTKRINTFHSGFAGGMATGAAAQILKTLAEQNIRNLHISVDIDMLDPEYAPGTGINVPDGVSPEELYRLLRVVMATGMVRAIDLVEYFPAKDRNEITIASVMSAMYGIFG